MIKLLTPMLFVLAVAQPASKLDTLVALLKPVLPFPPAAADGELPADNSATAQWFVVWPTEPDDTQVVVKANPLNADVQRASEEAMQQINAAVAAAERRAQAAYDKAVEQLRTGKSIDLETVTLDDEGIAGERIDAEQQVVIELSPARSFDIATGEAPQVSAGKHATTWVVTVPANAYRGTDGREHYRAAEMHVYFGQMPRPETARHDGASFSVRITPSPNAFGVIIRGNQALVRQLAADADWSALVPR
jgi:hypothetical protein